MKHVFVTILDKLQIVRRRNVGTCTPTDFERQRGAIARSGGLLDIRVSCSLHFSSVAQHIGVCTTPLSFEMTSLVSCGLSMCP